MAKDLPYFKFYVSEYNDGDIRLCSMEAQGLFINLCALFWSREGNLTLSKAKKKWPDTPPELWQELISEKIIKVRNDRVKINFLNEQLSEREKIRQRNAENGKNGGRPKTQKEPKGNPLGYFQEPKVKPIREEERREEQDKIHALASNVFSFLKRKGSNTSEVRDMVQQWVNQGHTDIINQLKAMQAHYAKNNLTFPTRIPTLTQSFTEADWIEKIKESNPVQYGKPADPDTIGTSAPGSLE